MNASTTSNPYAAPQSNVAPPVDDHIKYDGKLLSVTHPATLPNYCIKCGKACDDKQKTTKLSWTNPWWFISFFIIGILFIIVYLLVAKRLTVSYSLCAEHKAKVKKKNMILWSIFSLSVVLIMAGSMLNTQGNPIGSAILIAGISILAITLIVAVFLPRVIIIRKAKHVKNLASKRPYVFFLGGVDKSFVEAAKIKSSSLSE